MSMSYELILMIIIGGFCRLIQTSEDEHRLVHYLFSEQSYNPLVRPTQHSNQTIVVSFGLLLVQLIHVKKNLICCCFYLWKLFDLSSVGLWKRTSNENEYMVTYEMVCLDLWKKISYELF